MSKVSFELAGMSALVTGAGSGIGARLATGLGELGVRVGCLDISPDGVNRTISAIHTQGGEAEGYVGDVADPHIAARAVKSVEARFGALRLAVNCAGIHSTSPAEDMSADTWERLLRINLTGVFLSCQAEGRAMLSGGGGSIVNVGSISGHIANRGLKQSHYNSAKAALRQLSRSLALEWADRGIRVNVLSPGYVKTPLARGAETSRSLEEYLSDIPLGRMAETDELIGPTVFLLSQAASYCTGMELIVDGGTTSW